MRLSCRPIVCMLTFHVENMGPNAVFFRRFRLSEAYSHNAPSMRKASNNIALMVVTSILHHSYLLHAMSGWSKVSGLDCRFSNRRCSWRLFWIIAI